ncbi:MAG: OmpA family protein [Treponema sp.]|nr:OmpA family protein [Treponema sp.]
MKRIVKAIMAMLLLGSAFNVFAEETDAVFRLGGFGQGNAIINGHSNDAAADLGGGISMEIGLPVTVFGKQNGFSFHGAIDTLLGEKDPVTDGTDIDVLFGYWMRFPLGDKGFALQPEISYGGIAKSTKPAETEYAGSDQLLQLGLSLRYNPKNFANGMLEFELTPTFGIETFNSPNSIYVGGRVGMLIVFGGSKNGENKSAAKPKTDDRAEENKIVEQTKKEIESDPDLKGAVSVRLTDEGVTISLDTINFKPDSFDLMDSEFPKLDKIAVMLKRYTNDLHVVGHCAKTADSTPEADVEFSKKRADTVANYLILQGVRRTNTKMTVSGKGSSEPRGDNNTEAGRQLNRRVEITLVRKY